MKTIPRPGVRGVLTLLAALTLTGCGGFADSAGEPAHRASTTPSGKLRSIPAWEASDGGAHVPIEPGTYLIPRSAWSVADVTVTFPEGWTVQYGHVYARNGDQDDEFGFYAVVVDEIYTDSCGGEEGIPRVVGPGVDALVTALLGQAGGAATSQPVATTLGGYPATRIDLRIPKRLDLAKCRFASTGLQIWYSEPADKYFVLLADAEASVYVVDVHGERQVFLTQVRNLASAADRAELQTVLDSIRIRADP